jgi:predicted branched-subunit amino acid permease
LPLWTGFAIAFLALVLAAWRSPRTPAGFAASASIVFFAFFSFAKQAFCNYYFMILGAICCAVAALHSPPRSTS